jgi:hypothetical protein
MSLRHAAIAIAGFSIAVNAVAQKSAQKLKSFDPAVLGTCETAIGPPEDDSMIASRGWILSCGEFDEKIEDSEFAALRVSEAKASRAESVAYSALVAAFEKYRKLQLHLNTVGCGGGNSCGAMMVQEEARINYSFLVMAEGFRGAAFPSFSAGDFSDADAALNRAYHSALATYPEACATLGSDDYSELCASRADLRAMERAWIGYRDSWVAFGAVKWPAVSADSWRTYLSREHVKHGGDGTSD